MNFECFLPVNFTMSRAMGCWVDHWSQLRMQLSQWLGLRSKQKGNNQIKLLKVSAVLLMFIVQVAMSQSY